MRNTGAEQETSVSAAFTHDTQLNRPVPLLVTSAVTRLHRNVTAIAVTLQALAFAEVVVVYVPEASSADFRGLPFLRSFTRAGKLVNLVVCRVISKTLAATTIDPVFLVRSGSHVNERSARIGLNITIRSQMKPVQMRIILDLIARP